MDLPNVKWQVSLSNGETFFEGKGNFQEISGVYSPWQKLGKYIAEKKLNITSLSLYTDDGRTFNLPSAGKNPKFSIFDRQEKPIDYDLRRWVGREIDVANNQVGEIRPDGHFTTIVAIYPTYELQLWVDENNTQNCWSLVVRK